MSIFDTHRLELAATLTAVIPDHPSVLIAREIEKSWNASQKDEDHSSIEDLIHLAACAVVRFEGADAPDEWPSFAFRPGDQDALEARKAFTSRLPYALLVEILTDIRESSFPTGDEGNA